MRSIRQIQGLEISMNKLKQIRNTSFLNIPVWLWTITGLIVIFRNYVALKVAISIIALLAATYRDQINEIDTKIIVGILRCLLIAALVFAIFPNQVFAAIERLGF